MKPIFLKISFFFLSICLLVACQEGTETITPTSVTQNPDGTAEIASPTPEKIPTEKPTETAEPITFDGQSSYEFLLAQMELGPRWPGSPGHQAVREYIASELHESGWQVEAQPFRYMGFDGLNLIGKANIGLGSVIILGAHYDTRKIADQTPGSDEPVPGAVDGASGVAVLLEMARALDLNEVDHEIWLAFFDVEDNGSDGIPGYDWIVGSTYMAQNLLVVPDAMILVDMIGDADQQLYYEGNSNQELQAELWDIAADLGYEENFIPEMKFTMIDDHVPFAQRGIPSVDIIDFDYPYWHTVEDTADKASPESLERVGRTIEVWLEEHLGQ